MRRLLRIAPLSALAFVRDARARVYYTHYASLRIDFIDREQEIIILMIIGS